MNFFGGSNCTNSDCGGGCDCCSLLFLILLLQNCGGNFGGFGKGGEICIDCGTILTLMLLSGLNCGGCK